MTKKSECPPEEDIPNCVCDLPRKVDCNNIMNPQQLHSIMDVLSDYSVPTFRLNKAFLMYLPSGMFKKVPIKTLFIRKSEILGLETDDGSKMFQGAEDSLETIRLHSIKGLTSWRWSVFGTLKKLTILEVLRGELNDIRNEFTIVAPKTLTRLTLELCHIKHISPQAFAKHTILTELSLNGNELSELKRSMFPNPAENLKYILLDDNKLSVIPEDLFNGMHALNKISLKNNKIRHISIDTFKPLIGREFNVFLNDNDLYCCGDLVWIVEEKLQKMFEGNCKHPQILEGKQINSMKEIDFTHGLC